MVGGGGTQVEISGAAAQPVFPPVFCTEVETETPLSPDCSLIILSNEKEGAKGKMHANCSSFIRPAYGVCNHKPGKILTAQ